MFVTKQEAEQRQAMDRHVLAPGEDAVAGTRQQKRKVAVFVAHGMGQQVPFETMDSVAAGLIAHAERNGRPKPVIRTRTCLLDGVKLSAASEKEAKDPQKLQRIEIDLPDAHGQVVEVHIYEGYWASITEGQVTIVDVMKFLWSGGLNGIRKGREDFRRWLFDSPVNFGKQRGTVSWLGVALAVLGSLVFANFLITVTFADQLVGRISGTSKSGLAMSHETFSALIALMAAWVLFSGMVGWMLTRASKSRRPTWTKPLWYLLGTWVAATVVMAVVPLIALAGVPMEGLGLSLPMPVAIGVWLALLFVSREVRNIMIQFPGDVAAYISTHTLDRFQEIRTRIKERVACVARAIYSDKSYAGVVWVGHSLGSVVVYDALNGLLTDDGLAKDDNKVRAVARTRLLVTFGSPLDKIAFIFAAQARKPTETRDMLAASFQPLILDYESYRKIPWVNIWSPADIISGELDFYDDLKKSKGLEVQNKKDPQATTPLMAHIEYWENPLLFENIYEGIVRKDEALAAVR